MYQELEHIDLSEEMLLSLFHITGHHFCVVKIQIVWNINHTWFLLREVKSRFCTHVLQLNRTNITWVLTSSSCVPVSAWFCCDAADFVMGFDVTLGDIMWCDRRALIFSAVSQIRDLSVVNNREKNNGVLFYYWLLLYTQYFSLVLCSAS